MVFKRKKPAAAKVDPKKESGDYLGDDYVAENIASGDEDETFPKPSILEDDDEEEATEMGKKRKNLEMLKEKRKKARNGAPKREDACAISTSAAKKQAGFFLKHLRTSEVGNKLSDIQVLDATKPSNFVQMPREEGLNSLDVLADNLVQHAPACSETRDREAFPGAAPVVVIVVSSAERGARVWEALATLNKQNPVVKAFGNHQKVKKLLDKFLESPKAAQSRIIVGTAGRLSKLFQAGSLLPDRISLFVVDMNPDSKGRTLLDIKECKNDVMSLLFTLLLPRLLDESLKIAFA